MLVLVANLGSTSFKFKLLDMDAGGDVIARPHPDLLAGFGAGGGGSSL